MISLYCYEVSPESTPIRYMLNHAGVSYEDNIINHDSDNSSVKLKIPCIRLIDGKIISESNDICNYLAKKYDYLPAKTQEIQNCKTITKKAFIILQKNTADLIKPMGNGPESELKLFLSEVQTNIITHKDSFIYGSKVTCADFVVFSIVSNLPDSLKENTYTQLPFVKKYIKNFQSEVLNKIGIMLNYSTICFDV